MPTYQRFEDLPVWRDAIRLAEGCEDYIDGAKECITWAKRDQLERASLSVSNNIAEGFERGTTNQCFAFFERRPRLMHFKSQISNLKFLAESCSRQIRGWADSLQNSNISGPRHLNDLSRANYQKQKARESGAAGFPAAPPTTSRS